MGPPFIGIILHFVLAGLELAEQAATSWARRKIAASMLEKMTYIELGVGLDQPDKSGKVVNAGAGGILGNMILFNKTGDMVGDYQWGAKKKITHGTVEKVYPNMYSDDSVHYTTINGGSNAVCLAWVKLHGADDENYIWTGDIAEACQQDWYFSGLRGRGIIGIEGYEPKCMWLSSVYLDEKPVTGFQIHWPSYRPKKKPGTSGDKTSDYELPTLSGLHRKVCNREGAVFRPFWYPEIYTANIVGYRYQQKWWERDSKRQKEWEEARSQKNDTDTQTSAASNGTLAGQRDLTKFPTDRVEFKLRQDWKYETCDPWTKEEASFIRKSNMKRAHALRQGKEFDPAAGKKNRPQRMDHTKYVKPWDKEGFEEPGEPDFDAAARRLKEGKEKRRKEREYWEKYNARKQKEKEEARDWREHEAEHEREEALGLECSLMRKKYEKEKGESQTKLAEEKTGDPATTTPGLGYGIKGSKSGKSVEVFADTGRRIWAPSLSMDNITTPASPSHKKDEDLTKKQIHRRSLPLKQLVVDSLTGNSAIYLCSSPSSRGPDFANTKEQLFCDMSDKTVHPFCNTSDKNFAAEAPCFDLDSQQLVRSGIVKRTSPYGTVMDWRDRSGREKPEVSLTR